MDHKNKTYTKYSIDDLLNFTSWIFFGWRNQKRVGDPQVVCDLEATCDTYREFILPESATWVAILQVIRWQVDTSN